jgi:hypothetical protein
VEERAWVSAERNRCLQTGAWLRATTFTHVSRAFIVEHNGKRRLVINFAHLNSFHNQPARLPLRVSLHTRAALIGRATGCSRATWRTPTITSEST